MARKKESKYLGFSTWDTNDYLRECPNVARWNPRLAISWMNSVRSRIFSEVQTIAYNNAVSRINQFLDALETYDYYHKEDYWENDRPQRLEPLEDLYSTSVEILKSN